MNISIFGLGYVGCVSLACLAQNGHRVIGVDIDKSKVDCINRGKSPVIEPGLEKVIAEQKEKSGISATTNGLSAIENTEVSFICTGTPSQENGHLDLTSVVKVSREMGAGIAKKKGFHVVAIRSTVFPGTNSQVSLIIDGCSGKKNRENFSVVSNPEFLREGSAIKDYFGPPYTLIGSESDRATKIMKAVYKNINAPFIVADIPIVELIKYVNNSFHALKISFANEIGRICKKLSVDSCRLMDIFCLDTKLNLGPAYLKPGFAYGGSCLPKDLKALSTIAHDHYLKCPVLESISLSNEAHKETVLNTIIEHGKRRVGFLGLSFKEGTDDLRYSPIIDILERLLGKGFEISIYDRNVSLARLIGSNRKFIQDRIPFISRFITEDLDNLISSSDLIVVVNNEEIHKKALERLPEGKLVLDLVNIDYSGKMNSQSYSGISW